MKTYELIIQGTAEENFAKKTVCERVEYQDLPREDESYNLRGERRYRVLTVNHSLDKSLTPPKAKIEVILIELGS